MERTTLFGEVDEAHGPHTLYKSTERPTRRHGSSPFLVSTSPPSLKLIFPPSSHNTAQFCNSRPFRGGPRPQYQLTAVPSFGGLLAHLAPARSAPRLFLIRASWSLHKERRAVFVLLVKPLVAVLLRPRSRTMASYSSNGV
jgi:hypothetical protein